MKVRKKQIVCVLCSFVAICFYILSVHQMHLFEEKLKNVTFAAKGSMEFMINPSQDEQNGVLWRADEGVQVKNEDLGRMAETTAFALHGRSDYLLGTTWVLDTESSKSCIVSSALSYELFGNAEGKGLKLQYNGNSYEIVDVIKHEENLFFYEPTEAMGVTYERFTRRSDEEKTLDVIEEEMQRAIGNGAVLDYTVIRMLLDMLLLMIPVLVGILLVKNIRTYQKEGKSKTEKWVWGLILGLAIIVLLFGIASNIHFPADVFPEKWSGFQFWARKFGEKKDALFFLVKIPKTIFDMEILQIIKNIVVYQGIAICAFLFMFVPLYRRKIA